MVKEGTDNTVKQIWLVLIGVVAISAVLILGDRCSNTVQAAYDPKFRASATLDFPNITAGSEAELTISVTGASFGDSVIVGEPSAMASGIGSDARVSSANTVTIRVFNYQLLAAVNPASATWNVQVIK